MKLKTAVEYNISDKRIFAFVTIKEFSIDVWNALNANPDLSDVISKTYIGIATRKPEDELNIPLARKVARKKAMRAMYKAIMSTLKKGIKESKRDFNLQMDIYAQLSDRVKNVENGIKEIVS